VAEAEECGVDAGAAHGGGGGGGQLSAAAEALAATLAGLDAAPAAGAAASGGGSGTLRVRNVYFETVPLELITGGIVTEQGVMTGQAIGALVAQRRREYWEALLAVEEGVAALEATPWTPPVGQR
jgi:hypothetical protein